MGCLDCWWWQRSQTCSFLGLNGVVLLLIASACVLGVDAHRSEVLENFSLLVGVGDLDELDNSGLLLDRHGLALGLELSSGGLKDLSGSISKDTLLWLSGTLGENDKLASVGLESLDVHVELLLAGAGSSVIYGDSNGLGLSGCDTCFFQFLMGEATAEADFTGVLTGSLGNNGAKGVSGSGEDAGSLGDSILVSLNLLSGLVEVSLNSS
jgi:hypothetical protein